MNILGSSLTVFLDVFVSIHTAPALCFCILIHADRTEPPFRAHRSWSNSSITAKRQSVVRPFQRWRRSSSPIVRAVSHSLSWTSICRPESEIIAISSDSTCTIVTERAEHAFFLIAKTKVNCISDDIPPGYRKHQAERRVKS